MNHNELIQQQASVPLVSVIIPCYNQAHFLDDAIQSALDQTYPNIEILVVDDGSTDATREHAKRYSTVRYIHQHNQGLSAARNTGTHASRGTLLVYLDSDDRLLPNAVQANLDYMMNDPTLGFVAGHFRYINTDGSFQHENERHGIHSDYYLHFLSNNFIGMHATVMYRRDAIQAIGNFDPVLRACEDYDMYLRISKAYPIACHGMMLAEYRRHGQGLSNNSPLMLASARMILERERRYIRQHHDPRLLAAYKRGVNTWRNRYGREMLVNMVIAARRGRWAVARSQFITLFPHIPGGFSWLIRRVLPVLSVASGILDQMNVVQVV